MARTKKTDPAKKADKTVKTVQDTGKEPEALETGQAPAQEQTAAEEGQPTAQEQTAAEEGQSTAQESDMFAGIPNPCVYCGPSVKGVARQYTTYQGGITDELREFIERHPEALGLIVSTGKFQNMRRRLETPGTPESELYKKIKAGL